MDERAEQKIVIERLREQIASVFGWVKKQVRINPLLSFLAAILFLLLVGIVWETSRRNNLGFGEYTDPTNEYYRAKTLWDWMELLIIPIVLAIGAWWLNKSERENEQEIAKEKRNQDTMEAYFDRMVELLVDHNLLGEKSKKKKEMLSTIARTRTLAVLRSLDGERKGHVARFLRESDLLSTVDLTGADLSEADLRRASLVQAVLWDANLTEASLIEAVLTNAVLEKANLRRADLRKAYLMNTNLKEADLREADLREARLFGADLDLSGADLSGANLNGARVFNEDEKLAQAKSLKGATLPDGTKHD